MHARFRCEAKKCTVLIGPNGSGKSTTLSAVIGLLQPCSGDIVVNETVWFSHDRRVNLSPQSRKVGWVPQGLGLFPHMSVFANVMFGTKRNSNSNKKGNRARVDALCEELNISQFRDRKPGSLSGGEQQRVALARALAGQPDVLLLDEALSAIDVENRSKLRVYIQNYILRSEIPTLMVTHDPVEALLFGDHIVVMEKGAISQQGCRTDVASRPRSSFVASTLGLNYYRVCIDAVSSPTLARSTTLIFVVVATEFVGAGHVVFSPSDVTLSVARPSGSSRNVFEAKVLAVIELPGRVRVILDAGEPIIAEVTTTSSKLLGVEPGKRFFCAVKSTSVVLYR